MAKQKTAARRDTKINGPRLYLSNGDKRWPAHRKTMANILVRPEEKLVTTTIPITLRLRSAGHRILLQKVDQY